MNGKTMATLLEKTRCNTAYLRRHVEVVEKWECEWKEIRNESVVKTFLAPASRPRWTMTQQEIIAAVVDGTLFGMVECDVCVPEELQACVQERERHSRWHRTVHASVCRRTGHSLEATRHACG